MPCAIQMGVDMVYLPRLDKFLDDHSESLDQIFTSRELAVRATPSRRLARLGGRFAAKEATLKALGSGMAQGMRWCDIETVSVTSGAPRLQLRGAVAELAAARGLTGWGVTLSHSGDLAVACVWARRTDASDPSDQAPATAYSRPGVSSSINQEEFPWCCPGR